MHLGLLSILAADGNSLSDSRAPKNTRGRSGMKQHNLCICMADGRNGEAGVMASLFGCLLGSSHSFSQRIGELRKRDTNFMLRPGKNALEWEIKNN